MLNGRLKLDPLRTEDTHLWIRLRGTTRLGNSWELEIFGDLADLDPCSDLFFELTEFFLHSRVYVAFIVVHYIILCPVYGSYYVSLLGEDLLLP